MLQGIDGTVIPASEAEGRDNVYVYEVVGNYTITSEDSWTWTRDDLERSDEGTATIKNKVLKGSLQITKNVLYNGREAVQGVPSGVIGALTRVR